jgi:hypothetical protein
MSVGDRSYCVISEASRWLGWNKVFTFADPTVPE